MFRTLQAIEPATAAEQSAYDAWLSQTSAREEARRDRLQAAEGVVPQPLWIVLLLSAALVLVYVLFFADSGERAVVQGLMAGSVTAVVVASLLVCKPVMTYGRPGERGETVIGCADLDEHVERGARLLGRRSDVEEGKRLTVGVMRVFDHPACFVGDVPVPAWVEELRR